MNNEFLYMQKLAGLITESQYKEKIDELSWAEIDKKMDQEREEKIQKRKAYAKTPQGKNAINAIKNLISSPYDYNQLDDLLQVLNLTKENFKYAADEAGMEYSSDAAGIRIFDDNYKNSDVSIDRINGEWVVG